MTTKTHEERENWRTTAPTNFEWTDRVVLFTLIFMAFITSVGSVAVHGNLTSGDWWDGWLQNLSTELFGAFLTFLLIETIVRERRKREDDERDREAYKRQLLREVRSRSNDTALTAVDVLRDEGLLTDGTLKEHNMVGANLERADLRGANLQGVSIRLANLRDVWMDKANLQGASLLRTNMQRADLLGANLEEAYLMGANLEEARLEGAKLQGAKLQYANLKLANLQRANLKGVNCKDANLQGADLRRAKFDEETILPDGTQYDPALGAAQFQRFTDPERPDFWNPEWIAKLQNNSRPKPHTTEELLASVLKELKLLRAGQKANGQVPGRGRR